MVGHLSLLLMPQFGLMTLVTSTLYFQRSTYLHPNLNTKEILKEVSRHCFLNFQQLSVVTR